MQFLILIAVSCAGVQAKTLEHPSWAQYAIERLKVITGQVGTASHQAPSAALREPAIVVGRRGSEEEIRAIPQERLASAKLADRVARYVLFLLKGNEPKMASDYLSEVLERRPDVRTLQAGDLPIDVNLLVNQARGAFSLLLPLICTNGANTEERYLRLSAIACIEGIVQKGQQEYCRSYLKSNIGASKYLQYLPATNKKDIHTVLIESCLALGCKQNNYYDELALKVDPRCQLAAFRLVEYYGAKRRFSDLRRIASKYVVKMASSEARDRYLKMAAGYEGVPDSPIDPIIPKANLGADPPQHSKGHLP